MNEDIFVIGAFFLTVIILSLGIPLVRAVSRRRDQVAPRELVRLDERLARMESAIETMAVEVERISEGQRFVTRLLAERESTKAALPAESK